MIKTLKVVKNGQPEMRGIWPIEFWRGWITRIMKYTGKINLVILMSESSISPLGMIMWASNSYTPSCCRWSKKASSHLYQSEAKLYQ